MSRSYDRNIERLKANISQRVAEDNQEDWRMAVHRGESRKKHVQEVRERLVPFSKALQDWKEKDIEKQKEIGVAEARKAKLDAAKALPEAAKKLQAIEDAKAQGELLDAFEDANAMDMEHHRLKKKMLDAAGTSAYPEANRYAQLSPWQQVGYAQEKLRQFNNSFEAKLAHELATSEKMIELGGIKFTPQEIKENNLAFPMKQAAIEILSEDIRKAHGIDKWSPEMLKLSKTEDVIQKAKDSQTAKFRERFNIESSMNTRKKADLEWKNSDKTGKDLQKLLLVTSATVDTKGNILGNGGAWKEVERILVAEGVSRHDPEYAAKLLNQPMPASMAKELGVKVGTTFAQQWPNKAESLRRAIKKGYSDEVKAEETYLKAGGTQLSNEFVEEARKGDLSTQRVNEYKREFAALGLPIPSSITNYETATMRDEREDKQLIEDLMASQRGYISNDQLDAFHPKAALEFREKAKKMEKSALKEHDAEAKIKAHMDTAFTNMGIKANEKSPAYVEALSNAKADYAVKYNKYIAMGYSSAEASHYALHAKEVTDKETGEVVPDSMGVLTEIRTNGEGSKYVITGQSVEKSLKAGHIRVARIASGKREMLEDRSAVTKKVIGGDYGHRQITSIKNNLEKYGERGLYMDSGAWQYYEGLARGRNPREGGAWGLIDAQLKASGHAGLNPATKPAIVDLVQGKGPDEQRLPDPLGQVIMNRRIGRTCQFPSEPNNRYVMNTTKDCYNNNGSSVWDREDNLVDYLRGN